MTHRAVEQMNPATFIKCRRIKSRFAFPMIFIVRSNDRIFGFSDQTALGPGYFSNDRKTGQSNSQQTLVAKPPIEINPVFKENTTERRRFFLGASYEILLK